MGVNTMNISIKEARGMLPLGISIALATGQIEHLINSAKGDRQQLTSLAEQLARQQPKAEPSSKR